LVPRGHAIECRINAEDPARGFVPTPGRLVRYVEPAGPGVRVDSGYAEGDEVPGAYDSLIAKLVVHGADREEARSRMLAALEEYAIEGVATTIPAHLVLLREPSYVDGSHDTTTVEAGGVLDELAAADEPGDVLMVGGTPVRLWNPAMAASAAAATHGGASGGDVVAPMQGTILKVLAAQGDEVEAGQPLVVLEAMKMENSIASPVAGVVVEQNVEVGETAGAGQLLARVE
ncbi:MAG TPA: biotin/lipoyl-containing protein, partial [Actinomycetota bacterium]|nr:biotin/lipoyl-containing protein [Actinomycetota bacterium]